MPDDRKVIKTINCGFPEFVEKVDLYDSTLAHIEENHPEEARRLPEIISTIEGDATSIHKSKTHPTAIIFVNENSTRESNGDPLRIPVKVYGENKPGIISTAYFSGSSDPGPVLWSKKK